MLYEFVDVNRDVIISRTRDRVRSRPWPSVAPGEVEHGVPLFLTQLSETLRLEATTTSFSDAAIAASAAKHGRELRALGFNISQVVHDYGDICQAITQLAVEQDAPIPAHEFRTLNLCLDDAIAEAVTEYASQRERAIVDQGTERLGALAHELRNLLNTAMLSFDTIAAGHVAPAGSTGLILGRSLVGLRDLIDRSLAEVRLEAGAEHRQRISVADLVEEIEIGAVLQARSRGVHFTASTVDRGVSIEGDRQHLLAAVSNLVQNALKFTRKEGAVSLTTRATAERVLFEVEDECGGLPEGSTEDLFLPFKQAGTDRSGLGLGLSICLKVAQAHGGAIRVRDLPGVGCIFTLDLPRGPLPPFTVVDGGKRGAAAGDVAKSTDSDRVTGGGRAAARRDRMVTGGVGGSGTVETLDVWSAKTPADTGLVNRKVAR
jgi:signal transduction histidine kinase